MLKKVTSVVIALIMLCSVAIVPASAVSAEDKILTNSQADAAVETAVAALVDADEDAKVEVSDDLADKITENANTPKEISWALAQFVFIEKSQVEAISDRIVANSKFTVKVFKDGKSTVYVAVKLLENPEIYDARVFINVVNKIAEKCDEVAENKGIDINSDNYNPMSYKFIAGELALHMILLDITEILGANDWNTSLKELYDRAVVAGLEFDENRIPPAIINFVGEFFMFFFNLFFG